MPKSVSNRINTQVTPGPALEKRTRRKFNVEYKLRILAETNACKHGALLRREKLYSNQLADWRREFAEHGVAGLSKSAPGAMNKIPTPRCPSQRRSACAKRHRYPIPSSDLPIGGIMDSGALPSNTSMRMGPHSLQVDAKGGIWITLAIGNRLVRFDPADNSFRFEELPAGIYPHTLRIDDRGRIWYTLAVSNHVGVYDPASGQHDVIRVPARSFREAVILRMIPFFLWLSQYVELDLFGGEGSSLPVPYGIDFAPDGGVWFSQLNAHRIGHIDPDSFEVTMIDTPFTAPRRMRFDSKGTLWIPGFSSNLVSSFNTDSGEFKSYELPIEPLGSETPYALNVDPATDDVWICGTNSDSLIRFEPETERFTVYPLPTRVTYTRDLDFSSDGGIWTSNSNAPAWQIETGIPRVLKLDPGRPAALVGAN